MAGLLAYFHELHFIKRLGKPIAFGQDVKHVKQNWRRRLHANQTWPTFTICIANPNPNHIIFSSTDGPGVPESETCTCFPCNLFGAVIKLPIFIAFWPVDF